MNRKASWTVSRFGLLLALTLLLGLVIGIPTAYSAIPPHPTYDTATVDGDDSEWLASDWFAHMYRAGKTTKEIESDLYLRYDCSTNTLYALVLAAGGLDITDVSKPDEHWIKLGGAKKTAVNASSPNFEWIGLSVASDTAEGWEASVPLSEGSHTLNVHTNVWDDGKSQTSATPKKTGIEVEIACGPPFIGDRVWNDESGNGDQNSNLGIDEPGFNGVTVKLYSEDGDGDCDDDDIDDITGTLLATTATASGTSQDPDGWPDGIYRFGMAGFGSGEYCVYVDESTLPSTPVPGYVWQLTTTAAGNPQYVNFTGTDDFSFDFGYIAVSEPTFIGLAYFLAEPIEGGGVHFFWQTATEFLNAGFNLYVGESENDLTLINTEGMIPGAISSFEPKRYEYTASGVSGSQFWLEDVEFTGATNLTGPFQLGVPWGAPLFP